MFIDSSFPKWQVLLEKDLQCDDQLGTLTTFAHKCYSGL